MGSNTEKKPWPIYKTYTKIEAKRLRTTIFAITKLADNNSMGSNKEKFNIAIVILEKLSLLKGNKNYFAFWWYQ